MGLKKASLLHLGIATFVFGLVAAPSVAKADFTNGLSVRAGFMTPARDEARDLVNFGAWSLGLDYKLGFVPQVMNGENWTTSLSVDVHYSDRSVGIVRYVPISLNQIYTFEEQDGKTPYAGFCVTAATMGATGMGSVPTVTRLGGGLILGLNLSSKTYIETRYEWIDKHGLAVNPEGFRTYVGLRF